MEIRVRINTEGALRNQRYAFTDRFTLISELLQNARRAGATLIEVSHDEESRTLRVRDNGRGLDDFQRLLMLHESGWDEAICRQDQPFGVGFSKCLYAATRCVVRSNGHEVDFDTAAALAQRPITVRTLAPHAGQESGTVVELYGVNLPGLAQRIGQMCRDFAVDVEFNGSRIGRPDAADALEYRATPVGAVLLVGTRDGRSTRYTRIYLQGFCVHRTRTYQGWSDAANVVHLDSTRFLARLQASNFIDSHEHFHEEDQEADVDALEELIRRHRAIDPKLTLRSMLEDLKLERYPVLRGKAFRLAVGQTAQDLVLESLD